MKKYILNIFYFAATTVIIFTANEIATTIIRNSKATLGENIYLVTHLALQIFTILLFTWHLSRKFNESINFKYLLLKFPAHATIQWTAIGILIPSISIIISHITNDGEYSFVNLKNLTLIVNQISPSPTIYIFAAALEEIIHRGLILSFIIKITQNIKHNIIPAIIIEATIFALLHKNYEPLSFAKIFLFGSIMCTLRLRYKSLIPCIGLHSSINIIQEIYKGTAEVPSIIQHNTYPNGYIELIVYSITLYFAHSKDLFKIQNDKITFTQK